MPELPEVETTLRGLKPHITQQKVVKVIIRHPQLRWPVPMGITSALKGQIVNRIYRRAKYLLFDFNTGTLLLHLGMSGRLRILSTPLAPQPHDHIDICFANQKTLRFTDPRRFGALLWVKGPPEQHPLLVNIGPEPLSAAFDGAYLWQKAQRKKMPVKSYIMDSAIVAGVGNIYAAEALFQAKIAPHAAAGSLSLSAYTRLAAAIKSVLSHAIAKGGTTLKDFTKSDGSPGYFRIELQAYGRGGEPCTRCRTMLVSTRIGQRSTVYCPTCQR